MRGFDASMYNDGLAFNRSRIIAWKGSFINRFDYVTKKSP